MFYLCRNIFILCLRNLRLRHSRYCLKVKRCLFGVISIFLDLSPIYKFNFRNLCGGKFLSPLFRHCRRQSRFSLKKMMRMGKGKERLCQFQYLYEVWSKIKYNKSYIEDLPTVKWCIIPLNFLRSFAFARIATKNIDFLVYNDSKSCRTWSIHRGDFSPFIYKIILIKYFILLSTARI